MYPQSKRALSPGIRKLGYKLPTHGAVKVIYNRDFPGIEGSLQCSHCRLPFRIPTDFCPNCQTPVKASD